MLVVGFDIGALGQHLRSTGAGWLASEMKASVVKAALNRARRCDDWARAIDSVEAWQEGQVLQGQWQAVTAECSSSTQAFALSWADRHGFRGVGCAAD